MAWKERLALGTLLSLWIVVLVGAGLADGAVGGVRRSEGQHRSCGVVRRSDVPVTQVVVEIGKTGCIRARHVIGFALAHVRAAGVAVAFQGPRGWACTRGVFPLQPGQRGARYDTAHAMSCVTPVDTSSPRLMIAGFFLN